MRIQPFGKLPYLNQNIKPFPADGEDHVTYVHQPEDCMKWLLNWTRKPKFLVDVKLWVMNQTNKKIFNSDTITKWVEIHRQMNKCEDT